MITTKLKTILTDSGCTLVLYESSQLANLLTDQSKPNDIIGLILQPNDVTKEIKANAIHNHYPPIRIEILKQSRLEDPAENNETILELLDGIVDKIIMGLIASGDFKKITSFTVTKILETRYDANVIGWSMPLDLYYLENKNCL